MNWPLKYRRRLSKECTARDKSCPMQPEGSDLQPGVGVALAHVALSGSRVRQQSLGPAML